MTRIPAFLRRIFAPRVVTPPCARSAGMVERHRQHKLYAGRRARELRASRERFEGVA